MNSIPSPVASEQGEGRPVPYAVYQRAQERIQALLRENTALRQENNAYRRELAFLDQVDRVSGKTMSPGQKATFRATRRQLIERGADGTVSTAIDIWKIAKDTGQGNKTVGRHIKY